MHKAGIKMKVYTHGEMDLCHVYLRLSRKTYGCCEALSTYSVMRNANF